MVRDYFGARGKGGVPQEYAHRGLFWWRSVTAAYLWRLRTEIQDEIRIEEAQQRMGWNDGAQGGGVIGVHVRRGDSCHTSRRQGRCVRVEEHVRR